MTVLLVTHSRDLDPPALVERALRERGAQVLRLDTDRYPHEVALSSRMQGRAHRRILEANGQRVDLAGVTAVWNRRFAAAAGLPRALGDLRAAAVLEARHTLAGALAALSCFTVDPPERVARASRKELQLSLAARLGLRIPQTCITNDPRAARAFFEAQAGSVVMKLQHPLSVLRNGRELVVYTRTVERRHLRHLGELRWSPATFQERIERALDVRVTVVGKQVFAAALEVPAGSKGRDDWRADGARLQRQWRAYRLPAPVKRRVLELCAQLGLNYGAADFAVTPSGSHVFFELNPLGEFHWLERDPGFPIAEVIAKVLLEPRARLVNR